MYHPRGIDKFVFDSCSGSNGEHTANDICWVVIESDVPLETWRDIYSDMEVSR